MNPLRQVHSQRHGFTLIELMVVVAIVAALAMMAAPKLSAYRTREDARAFAETVRGVISEARSQAIARGRPTFVLFPTPGVPEWQTGSLALTVDDVDASFTITAGDATYNAFPRAGLLDRATYYGVGSYTPPFTGAAVPSEDANGGTLADLTSGTTFDTDPATGVPAIGFTTQGIPVSLQSPQNFGSGAGAVYVTDNDSMVLAVIVQPLGAVRVRVLAPGSDNWL